jgi:hypothetical protein
MMLKKVSVLAWEGLSESGKQTRQDSRLSMQEEEVFKEA